MNPNPSPTSHRRVPALLRLAVALAVGAATALLTGAAVGWMWGWDPTGVSTPWVDAGAGVAGVMASWFLVHTL